VSQPTPYTPPVAGPGSDGRLVIGFDLDMTLIDSRRSIGAAMTALAAETGVPIDVEHIVSTLGPPLEIALAPWFAGHELDAAVVRFREFHGELLHLTGAMPGAVAAVAAVHDLGGRVVVVTAKFEPHAWTSLQTVGISPDVVVGWLFGAAKAGALLEHYAQAYVGDHVADVAAAKGAGIVSVGVATGSTSPDSLAESGADVVLPDLLAFPEWLRGFIEISRMREVSEGDRVTGGDRGPGGARAGVGRVARAGVGPGAGVEEGTGNP
jgi:phosphoglycolate phosphatase-like HAD superfamily hydrolase